MPPASPSDRIGALLARIVDVRREEVAALLWSFAYFFCVLCAYYIIRPLRDEMGVTVGSDGLRSLFSIVFLVMLAAVPLFGWVVRRFPRRRIVAVVYAFFIANLIGFWLILELAAVNRLVAGAFFIWVSVFNLFVVSLFWSLMADVYESGQAMRLYGFIAAGGSAGAFMGPLITQSLVRPLGATNLLLVSALLLGGAILCAAMLRRAAVHEPSAGAGDDVRTRGGVLSGARNVLASPYLMQIALWVLIANLIGTFFYLEQARIVGAAIAEREARVQLFARMDLAVSVLTILAQVLLTGALMRRIGLGACAAALPAVAAIGLVALSMAPVLWVIVAAMVAERAVAFAISVPAARVLWTVVAPEDKYKAQNFIDTVVYRGGDAASSWIFNGLSKGLGMPMALLAALCLPFALVWLWLSFRLAREQAARAGKSE
jgi:AAA family ATP:ADP antiporter